MRLLICLSMLMIIIFAAGAYPQDVEPFGITIQKTHGKDLGDRESVTIRYTGGSLAVAGFDLLIGYDAGSLHLIGVLEGNIYKDYGWEFFSFRETKTDACGPDCPSGLLRIVGIAEANNGAHSPDNLFLQPGDTLATIWLDITDDQAFDCMYWPVRFLWRDCSDNVLTYYAADDSIGQNPLTAISRSVSDHTLISDITDPNTGYPTFAGAQDEDCFTGPPEDNPTRLIDFLNGGVDLICGPWPFERGDIDLNGRCNELADAKLLVQFLIDGDAAFYQYSRLQYENTDINADGFRPTIADLVYLFRIITGDAVPWPNISPETTRYRLDDGVFHTELSIGAAFFVVKGNDIPILLNSSAEMAFNFDGVNTRVLVYSMRQDGAFGGDLIRVNNEILDYELASYYGAPMSAVLVPTDYALHQNYPNPFNTSTTISFAMPKAGNYELVIYNLNGQKVAGFADYVEAGFVKVNWDAADFASGVYFYRLDIGDFSQTRKMVLLK